MRKWGGVFVVLVVAPVLLFQSNVYAKPLDSNQAVGNVPEGLKEKAVVDQEWEKRADTNGDGVVDQVEIDQWKNRVHGQSENSPAHDTATVDTGWERKADVNQDGVVDQAEINQWRSQHHGDKDNNPPGPKGGAGTNWENPPGSRGGPGASPNRRHK